MFDYVILWVCGGVISWENVVVVCLFCNLCKGLKFLCQFGLMLCKLLCFLSVEELCNMGCKFCLNYLYYIWLDFFYWDIELEVQ